MAGQKGNTNKPIEKEPLTETISIRFTKNELEEIEKIANSIDLPKTALIRNMALSGLDEAKLLHKIGALKGARKLIDFKERLFNSNKYPPFEALA